MSMECRHKKDICTRFIPISITVVNLLIMQLAIMYLACKLLIGPYSGLVYHKSVQYWKRYPSKGMGIQWGSCSVSFALCDTGSSDGECGCCSHSYWQCPHLCRLRCRRFFVQYPPQLLYMFKQGSSHSTRRGWSL